ncbi:MAG: hypothetical protein F6J93_25825 [Oscillatoria sp. SIO1A7]|nr:hypothetical protein [Oscillatoria sp. SIO1A7]
MGRTGENSPPLSPHSPLSRYLGEDLLAVCRSYNDPPYFAKPYGTEDVEATAFPRQPLLPEQKLISAIARTVVKKRYSSVRLYDWY